jgi:preprotein translocase subunit YajC
MAEKNHPVFILGLLIGIVAYLLIRRQLKDSTQKKP